MDLSFTPDQDALRDATQRLYAKESHGERVREVETAGFDPLLWRSVGQMGLPTMAVPEERGGAGASLTDLAAAVEVHGAHLGSVPLVETAVVARLLARVAEAGPEPDRVADVLDSDGVVGWFQGRMEYGPRSLGARSIIGDPRSPEMQRTMNLKIKFRESFRPFAPSVLKERAHEYFDVRPQEESPYMLLVADIAASQREGDPAALREAVGLEKLGVSRSKIQGVTHVDLSARIQTVDAGRNPIYHALISAFERRTGCPVVINTSFNVRGEPIVESPESAWFCFMATGMDALVLGRHILRKQDQPPFDPALLERHLGTFALD